MQSNANNRTRKHLADSNRLLAIALQHEKERQTKLVKAKRLARLVDCICFIVGVIFIFYCYSLVTG